MVLQAATSVANMLNAGRKIDQHYQSYFFVESFVNNSCLYEILNLLRSVTAILKSFTLCAPTSCSPETIIYQWFRLLIYSTVHAVFHHIRKIT